MTDSAAGDAHDKDYHIIVNGEPKTVETDVLTFDQVVNIAFPQHDPQTIFLVTLKDAESPKEGELVAGQEVTIKDGTKFDVDDTGKS